MDRDSLSDSNMIAPCGINCSVCLGHLQSKIKCQGCNSDDASKRAYCQKCKIKNCETIKVNKSGLCYECDRFPCLRLKQLDKRYRTKYSMSMIQNLIFIRESGMEEFLKNEQIRWKCKNCGAVICVHRTDCLKCGVKRE